MPSDDRTLIQSDLRPRASDDEVPSGLPAETMIQPDQYKDPGDEASPGAHREPSVRGTSDAAPVELDDSGPGMTPRLSGEAEDQVRQRSLGVPQVPDYDVKTLLGKGAFGEVWLAVERRTGKKVAIKFFSHGTGAQWESLQAEVKQLALLNSDPGIVQLIDFEPDPRPLPYAPRPRPYYVMTLAEGGSLAERLKDGPLPLEEALVLFRQIAEALAYVHVKGIRHCDLKPANILLDARGRAWIADFGQAHLSCDASPALGTFFYMAPEQASHCNQIPDTRWDVYGLGAIFYAMLTGHPPRETAELQEALKGNTGLSERLRSYRELAQSTSTPMAHRRVRGMDRLLAEIIDHCLAIDPERRWRDAGAVLAALDRRDRLRRQRPLLALGFVAPVVLLLSLFLSTVLIHRRAIETQQRVIDQLLEVNLENVKTIANMLDEQFSNRLKAQEQRAATPDLRTAIVERTPASHERLVNRLKQYYDQTANYGYVHWVIADRDGVVLVNYPPNPRTLGKNYSWRDWFNGIGDRYEEGRRYAAITAPHISQPFVGQSVDRIVGINISAPINDSDGKTVLGVLTVMIDLDKIYRWLYEEKIHRGFFVLLNDRYHCLVHKHRKEIEPRAGKNPPTWEGTTVYRDLIGGHLEGVRRSYRDPIDGHDYSVSYAPLRRIGWGLLIQQERDPIIQQYSDDLRPIVQSTILVNTIICGIFVPGLWGFIIWTLRKGEGPTNG